MSQKASWRRRVKVASAILLSLVIVVLILVSTGTASRASASALAGYVSGIVFTLDSGRSASPAPTGSGPLDVRLGYAALPDMVRRLEERGFTVQQQATVSDRFIRVASLGLFPPYPEPARGGLTLYGRSGALISSTPFPVKIYESFEDIPAPVRETLLFLENRELLDDRNPYGNPAIEWDRFVAALANFAGAKVLGGQGRFGASTLATQLEKVRHSRGGVTRTAGDKARQMASATLRSYLYGPLTSDARRRILLEYLNALPVGAMPRYGEVIGLRDGLHVWFALDPDSADAALRAPLMKGKKGAAAGAAYRGAMMLLLAQRRPSYYLQSEAGRKALVELADSHIRLIAKDSIIPAHLAAEALKVKLEIRTEPPPARPMPFVERKAINAARTQLANLLGVQSLYQLDRFDLTAYTTIDSAAQQNVTALLRRLADPAFVKSAGLDADRLLGQEDPSGVSYSVVLYERTPLGNALRVQVDNLNRPFDLNAGARLELGSTAKLRTLVTYLETVATLHGQLSDSLLPDSAPARRADDPISRWAREKMQEVPDISLAAMLDSAMQRRYSASPSETFFTGGGVHVFANFDKVHDRTSPTVLEGFRHSVNLVFVRLMRDLVTYHQYRLPAWSPDLLENPDHPARRAILERFATAEGRLAIDRALRRHRGLTRDSSLTLLLGRNASPQRYGRLLRALKPGLSDGELRAGIEGRYPGRDFSAADIAAISRAVPATLSLSDRAFVTGTEPLELWVVSRLLDTPTLTSAELQASGDTARRDASAWLLRRSPAVLRAQERALRIMLERDAFAGILAAWRKVGFPFEDIVPSLASSIGSSGDRPGALAELVGIISAGGMRIPSIRVEGVRFGAGTPFEVMLARDSVAGVCVMNREVAAMARKALTDVVENGTAAVMREAFPDIAIGGKTGTGDNVVRTVGRDGRALTSRSVSRTATFVFFIGDRHFGVTTAYVDGPAAARYSFTSGLPVRITRLLVPSLETLLREDGPSAPAASTGQP